MSEKMKTVILPFYGYQTLQQAADEYGLHPLDVARLLSEMYEDDSADPVQGPVPLYTIELM